MKSKTIFFVILAIVAIPSICNAAGLTIGALLGAFVNNVVWPLAAGATVIFWIWTGLLFLLAQGDPAKLSTARHALIWAVAGTVVIILAYSAVAIVQNALNLNAAPTPPAS